MEEGRGAGDALVGRMTMSMGVRGMGVSGYGTC